MSGRPDTRAADWFTTFVEGRRGEILDAALGVFATKGYDAGTLREIASAVGITEPALYRYWPGKEALFGDLIALAGDHVVDQACEALALIGPATVRPAFELLLSLPQAEPERGRLAMMRAMIGAAPNHPALAEAFRSHVARPMRALVAETVTRLDAQMGIVRAPAEAETCARVLMSLFVGHTFTTMMLEDAGAQDATVDAAMSVLRWDGPAR